MTTAGKVNYENKTRKCVFKNFYTNSQNRTRQFGFFEYEACLFIEKGLFIDRLAFGNLIKPINAGNY